MENLEDLSGGESRERDLDLTDPGDSVGLAKAC